MRPTLRRLSALPTPPVINITNATFHRAAPPPTDPTTPANDAPRPLFPDLTFRLDADPPAPLSWAVLGASSTTRTLFLSALRGLLPATPPSSVSYPLLDARARARSRAIQYVGFDAERGARGLANAHMAARYESHREAGDFSLRRFLEGRTELNPADGEGRARPDGALFERCVRDFMLARLLDMPVSRLSNGQTRRALIARALLSGPEVLMLNSPFSE
jgi:hypothetical protein